MRFRARDTLGPGSVGRRVTVRYRLDDGRSTDVIGVLEDAGDPFRVRRADGTSQDIPHERLVAARVHPEGLSSEA